VTKRIVIDAEERARWAEQVVNRGSGISVGELYDQLVGGWRTALLEAQDAALIGVSEAMARSFAANSLGALSIASLPEIRVPNLGRQIVDAIGDYKIGIGAGIADQLAESLRGIALAASSGVLTTIQRHDETERRYEQALWMMGWWVPGNVSVEFFWRVGELATAGRKREVRKLMVGLGRSRHLRELIDEWLEQDLYRSRRRFLLDGLSDHRRGRFRVSIPTLLPLIEGIAVEAFTPGARGPRRAFEEAAAVDMAVGPAMADIVTALYTDHTFSPIASGTRQLNRHLVMHGRSTGYGTEENSVKVLLALDTLAYFIEERDRLARESETP
jgi:hypothetical protein